MTTVSDLGTIACLHWRSPSESSETVTSASRPRTPSECPSSSSDITSASESFRGLPAAPRSRTQAWLVLARSTDRNETRPT